MSLRVQTYPPHSPDWHAAAKQIPHFLGSGGADEAAGYAVCRLLVWKGPRPLATLTLYQNPDLPGAYATTAVFAGTFACIDGEVEAAHSILRQATLEAAKLGAARIIGPLNGSTWHAYRLPLDAGGHRRFYTEPDTPPGYAALWEAAGFTPVEHYVSRRLPIPQTETSLPVGLLDRGILFQPLDTNDWEGELRSIYPLCMEAFRQARYFSPVSEGVFVAQYMRLLPIIEPGLTLVAIGRDGLPRAFFLALPDALDPTGKTAVLKTVAKHPDSKTPGLIETMVETFNGHAYSLGYRQVIHAFMHGRARSVVHSTARGSEAIRTYALFARDIR